MTTASIYGFTDSEAYRSANDTVDRFTNDTAHLNTAETQPQSISSASNAAGASLLPAIRGAINIEELKTLTARSRHRVKAAIAQYRAEEAEYKQQFHTERWWEKVPGFELLAGNEQSEFANEQSELAIPRGLLYRLFRRSKNGLNYWLLQHEGMNGSSKIKDSKLEHEYAINLAAAALGQGFDEGQDRWFPQTEKLVRAWWRLHQVQPRQPEMELLAVIGGALRRAKDRGRYTPELLAKCEATRKASKAERRRAGRKKQAEAEGREYKSKLSQPGKPGETANQVAGWLVQKSRQKAESEDLFVRAEEEERGWSVEQAVEELRLPRETIKKCLARLAAQFPEQVARVARGRYRFIG